MRSILLVALPFASRATMAQYALIVGGLGGSPSQTEAIRSHLHDTYTAFVEDFRFPLDNVTVLAEHAIEKEPFVAGISTAEAVRAHFEVLSRKVGPDNRIFVVLFGHGSYDGTRAHFNIPRRDLSDLDWAALVDSVRPARVIFINTTSASAPFIDALSAPNRIVITATRTGTQRNQTVFPRFLVEALRSPAADMDKSGSPSVREAFYFAALRTAESFDTAGHLATEHALLDDNGDGVGHRLEDLKEAGDGNLAAMTHFWQPTRVVVGASLLPDKSAIERDIATLMERKETLAKDAYYEQLERLFVALARLNDRIESGQR